MQSAASAIVVDVNETIAVVRFNRPQARNPLSLNTLKELGVAISRFTADDSITAIIFTGAEDVFAAGANIQELAALDEQRALKFARLGQELFQQINETRPMTIAAINGYCIGGGLDLALACDIRIASPQAVFAHPGARLGIITGWGGTQRLAQLIGRARAFEMLLTARQVSSSEAVRVGLVAKVADDPLAESLSLAKKRASPLRR
ncbi:MAG TPA: enoyl-CoA hydratase/isomerase family protein [Pyrinomonadaceae bacterium]|nr:enoyl-CoA hydratase/isomerase family protein [Pyrinomonadaceae bacterium]